MIPVYGMRELICRNNFIFVGDSAGLTDPITGAGIANAYESGQLAGDTIADYLNDKINNLDVYTFNEIAKSVGEKAPNSNEIER